LAPAHAVSNARGSDQKGMFTIVIFVQAVSSGWEDTYHVNPNYPSLEMCEAARPDVADGFRQFLERQHFQQFKVESKCVKDGDDA
jgi:hypothetical protein